MLKKLHRINHLLLNVGVMKDKKLKLSDTGFLGELEHLKIKTRLRDEKFTSVMGECVI